MFLGGPAGSPHQRAPLDRRRPPSTPRTGRGAITDLDTLHYVALAAGYQQLHTEELLTLVLQQAGTSFDVLADRLLSKVDVAIVGIAKKGGRH